MIEENMLTLKKYIWVCVAISLLTSCGTVRTEMSQTPSPVAKETQTPITTLTPEPTLTRTPVPTRIAVHLTEVGNFLTISQVFGEYGKPEEIWFSSAGKVPETWPTYVEIVLFYPDDNTLFLYWGKAEQSQDDDQFFVSICVAKYDDTTVEEFVTTAFTWRSPHVLKFEDLPTIPGNPDTHWKPLEEVTDTNADDFYSGTLADPETTCLKTPAEIWPNPNN
jgi:hypothetical protein